MGPKDNQHLLLPHNNHNRFFQTKNYGKGSNRCNSNQQLLSHQKFRLHQQLLSAKMMIILCSICFRRHLKILQWWLQKIKKKISLLVQKQNRLQRRKQLQKNEGELQKVRRLMHRELIAQMILNL
jgi:peptidyl-tRNA hydrolase